MTMHGQNHIKHRNWFPSSL